MRNAPNMRPDQRPAIRLGPYELGAVIGRGGSGTVHRAIHVTTGQAFAVKVLGRRDAPQFDRRFRREALLMSRLSMQTSKICKVVDFGVDEDGVAYTVMELLEGETLAARLRRAELTMAEIVSVIRQVGRALAVAHAANVIHRDLKPSNVFVVDQTATPGAKEALEIKLLDFGVAKPLDGDEFEATHDGLMIGTPAYMSPEQFAGARTIDRRADLWAFGALVHRMLVGAPPFGYGTALELAMRSSQAKVARASAANPNLPEAIDGWFDKALAKDPRDRFGDIHEMIRALAIILRPAKAHGPLPVPTPAPSVPVSVVAVEGRPLPVITGIDGPSSNDADTVIREVPAALLAATVELDPDLGPDASGPRPAMMTGATGTRRALAAPQMTMPSLRKQAEQRTRSGTSPSREADPIVRIALATWSILWLLLAAATWFSAR
jgi:serine/threonine-protein kinase